MSFLTGKEFLTLPECSPNMSKHCIVVGCYTVQLYI